MTNLLLRGVTFAIVCAVPVLLAGAQTGSSAAKENTPEQEARARSEEEVQGFLNKDRQALANLWSDDLIVTNPLNKLVNKQQVLGMIDSGFLVITSYDRQIEYAHVYGEMVVLAGSETVTWGGKMPAAGKAEHLRFTAIWMKQGGRWQEVVRHANIIPQT